MDLMNKIQQITIRTNDYLHCDSRSGTAMTRQTRDERGQNDLHRENLSLYTKLQTCAPSSVSNADLLR